MAGSVSGLVGSSGVCARTIAALLVVSLLAWPGATAPARAQPSPPDRGAAVLNDKCGRCHTLARTGPSPLPAAPPFRDVYERFAPRDLRAMLLQGMVSRHREMPQVELTEQDADAVLAFLHALAAGR